MIMIFFIIFFSVFLLFWSSFFNIFSFVLFMSCFLFYSILFIFTNKLPIIFYKLSFKLYFLISFSILLLIYTSPSCDSSSFSSLLPSLFLSGIVLSKVCSAICEVSPCSISFFASSFSDCPIFFSFNLFLYVCIT